MKNNLFIRIFKIRKDNVFVHIISNIIILCLLLCFYIGCLESAAVPTAAAPIYRGDASQKSMPYGQCILGEEYIPQMLDIFEKYNAKCTFLWGDAGRQKTYPCSKPWLLTMKSATTVICTRTIASCPSRRTPTKSWYAKSLFMKPPVKNLLVCSAFGQHRRKYAVGMRSAGL